MTDFEVTRWGAEAMGWRHIGRNGASVPNPLKNRRHAMDLLILYRLGITPPRMDNGLWAVSGDGGGTVDRDLLRAICLCVAGMQAAKDAGRLAASQ